MATTEIKLLLVDDHAVVRAGFRRLLEQMPGIRVVAEAGSGDEAYRIFGEYMPDVLVMDLSMPGMGGLEACRRIRASSEIAIIMLTVRSDEVDKVAALDAGADDYVAKPFSLPELLARIRAALRRIPVPPEGGPPVIQLEGIEINLTTRRVIVGGRGVRLTPKEFDLLSAFALQPGVILSRLSSPLSSRKTRYSPMQPDFNHGSSRSCTWSAVQARARGVPGPPPPSRARGKPPEAPKAP